MTPAVGPPEPLTVAVRADTERVEPKPPKRPPPKGDWRKLIPYALVFDTETRVDRFQALMFGCWQFCSLTWERDGSARLACVEEGLLYADGLPRTDPEGFEVLRRYALLHDPDTAPPPSAAPTLRLLSRRHFVDYLYRATWRQGIRATIVGFNLPFDLSRLAVGWGAAKDDRFAGGFSLILQDYPNPTAAGRLPADLFRPRIKIKSINSKAALMAFSSPPNGGWFEGHFLDLRTLTFSHTNEGHSLESACETFGVPYTKRKVEHGKITPEYITYCREDARATERLCSALLTEHARHPITLQPTKAFSPASIGKAYLRAMGITPALKAVPDFPKDTLGYSMSAYYGGRSEVRIRRQAVPVMYLDFLSMYTTVCSLLELWPLMTSCVQAREVDPSEIRRWLAGLTPDKLFEPASWNQLRFLVQILPEADIFPVRARYGQTPTYNIGVNPYTSSIPQWYALPDIVASTILRGKPPKILRAIRLDASPEPTPGLTPLRLRGEVLIDPVKDDFFRRVIEQRKLLATREDLNEAERKRLDRFLKCLASSTAYGIYAELNRSEQPTTRRVRVEVYGRERYQAEVIAPEDPGDFYFPPIATLITSAAKLMLALLEHEVTARGGSCAFGDTDSMAIVATGQGGLIPCPGGEHQTEDGQDAALALSRPEVRDIIDRFAGLNPYVRTAVSGSILEIEKVNYQPGTKELRQLYAYAISAKRYVLYTLEGGYPRIARIVDEDDSGAPGERAIEDDDDGAPEIVEAKQHGLGHLLSPIDPEDESRDWITELWHYIVRVDGQGLPAEELDWLDRSAITRLTTSKPRLLRPFDPAPRRRTKGKSDAHTKTLPEHPEREARPYNFLLTAHVDPLNRPPDADPHRFQLVAPYSRDPRQWRKMKWTDASTGRAYRIVTSGPAGPGEVLVKTYRDVLEDYRTHPETKSAGPDGQPCERETSGLLQRRHITTDGRIRHIGKEAHRLEDREAEVALDPEELLIEYVNPVRDDFRERVLPILREQPVGEIAEATGLSVRTIKRARAGKGKLHRATIAKLASVVTQNEASPARAAITLRWSPRRTGPRS